jgi:hypothetical protein
MRTLLRTLTAKSPLKFGQYSDSRVGELLKMQFSEGGVYLSWVYFHCDKISFVPEVLEELRIDEDLIIEKPGKDPSKFFKWKSEKLTDLEKICAYHAKNRHQKREKQMDRYFHKVMHGTSSRQRRNHGKSVKMPGK